MKPEEKMDEIEIWDDELQGNIILRFKHGKKIWYNGIQIEEVREGNGWKTVKEANVNTDIGFSTVEDSYAPAQRERVVVKPWWKFW